MRFVLEECREYFVSLHNPNNLTHIENTDSLINRNSPSENGGQCNVKTVEEHLY